ncbi:MAG: DUF2089 domain-containing protein [Planctomycetes bacterium]|nr:DUF2089 domain-containing protein [Planctomycetota bacterium]
MSIIKAECKSCKITLDGSFTLPQLAQLTKDEQNFIVAFVKVHGSIKKMEDILDISYPTVKNKLNELADKLELDLAVNHVTEIEQKCSKMNNNCAHSVIKKISKKFEKPMKSASTHVDLEKTEENIKALSALGNGEISIEEAIEKLRKD